MISIEKGNVTINGTGSEKKLLKELMTEYIKVSHAVKKTLETIFETDPEEAAEVILAMARTACDMPEEAAEVTAFKERK